MKTPAYLLSVSRTFGMLCSKLRYFRMSRNDSTVEIMADCEAAARSLFEGVPVMWHYRSAVNSDLERVQEQCFLGGVTPYGLYAGYVIKL